MRAGNRSYALFCVVVALISVFAVLHRIGEIPEGFYTDESSVGYNAYCINKTGMDEHGARYPLFFMCFGNYQDPVMIYSTALSIRVFGLNKFAARFPAAVFSIAASLFFCLLCCQFIKNRWVSAAAGFLFSSLPWVFPLSRISFGYTAMLLGFNAGTYFMLLGVERKSWRLSVLSAFCWSFAMYSHNCAKPMAVIVIACLFIALWTRNKGHFKEGIALASTLLLCLAPMLAEFLKNPFIFTHRLSDVSVVKGDPIDAIWPVMSRYFDYFSPAFLFLGGDPNLRHHTGNGGMIGIFYAPFLLAGLWLCVLKFRKSFLHRFLLLAFLSYPLIAIITLERFHATRTVNGAPFVLLMALAGYHFISLKLFKCRCLTLMFIVLAFLNSALYLRDYFNAYPERSRYAFQAPFIQALEICFREMPPGGKLFVSASAFPEKTDVKFWPDWYIHILFFGKIPPPRYLDGGIPEEMATPYKGITAGPGLFLRSDIVVKEVSPGKYDWFHNSEPPPKGARLLWRIPYPCQPEKMFFFYGRVVPDMLIEAGAPFRNYEIYRLE